MYIIRKYLVSADVGLTFRRYKQPPIFKRTFVFNLSEGKYIEIVIKTKIILQLLPNPLYLLCTGSYLLK